MFNLTRSVLAIFAVFLLCSYDARAQDPGADVDTSDSAEYLAGFTSDILGCPNDYDNKFDMEGLKLCGDEEGGTSLSLTGVIDVKETVGEGYEIELAIFKELELGDEFMWSARGQICDSLTNQNAPWSPFATAANVSECPILEGSYPISHVELDLSSSQGVMNRQNCGSYIVYANLYRDTGELIACNQISAEVFENKNEK